MSCFEADLTELSHGLTTNQITLPPSFYGEIHDGCLTRTAFRLSIGDPHPARKLGADAPLYRWQGINFSQFAYRPEDLAMVVWPAGKVAPDIDGQSFSGFVLVRPGVREGWLKLAAPNVETIFVTDLTSGTPDGPRPENGRPVRRIVGLNTGAIERHDAPLAKVIDDYANAAAEFVQRRYREHGYDDNLDKAYAKALNDTRNVRHSAINWIACIISSTASIEHRAEAWRELREHESVWLTDKPMRKATRKLMAGLADYLTRREGVEATRKIRSLRPSRSALPDFRPAHESVPVLKAA